MHVFFSFPSAHPGRWLVANSRHALLLSLLLVPPRAGQAGPPPTGAPPARTARPLPASLRAERVRGAGPFAAAARPNCPEHAAAAATSGYVQISAGASHSLALRFDSTVYAWGSNIYGQLGDNSHSDHRIPAPLPLGAAPAGTHFRQVSVGGYESVVLAANGKVYACGNNSAGELGDNSTTDRLALVAVAQGAVPPGTRFVQISAGQSGTLGLTADGAVYGWGVNTAGQLGDNTQVSRLAPVATALGAAPAGTRFVQVAAGGYHSLALAADGTLYAWGANDNGQLGDNTTTRRLAPVAVALGAAPAGTRFVQVAAGSSHSLAVAADGTVYSWGYNGNGELGDNTTADRHVPGAVDQGAAPAGTRFVQVAAGRAHALALTATGAIYAWGRGNSGQLGDNTSTDRLAPVRESFASTDWTAVAAGESAYFSLALGAGGAIYGAGYNGYGQLGDGTDINSPVFVRNLGPLPVQLVAFTAQASRPAAVRLAWATASEANSAYFTVERSPDGAAFAAIGQVAAAGHSAAARTYAFIDERLPAQTGSVHYRLREVDQDGTASYSPVRTVTVPSADLGLFPNPTRARATLTGASAGAAVQVLDALGRVVATATTDASGTTVLPGGVPAGLYVVRCGGHAARLAVE